MNLEQIDSICREFQLHQTLATVLFQRIGGDFEEIRRFFSPALKNIRDPGKLPDIARAVERLVRAVVAGEKLLVHGDYDVDGISACALVTDYCTRLGLSVIPFIPERELDGYGLSKRGIESAREKGVTLIISCDCGVTAVDEVALANSYGIDVIITDHHLPGEKLPASIAVVNPNRTDSEYGFSGLCGTGVAFCLLVALRAELRKSGFFMTQNRPEPELRDYLDLVALATLADAVPLVHDNRIFVSQGLRALAASPRPGLRALLWQTGLFGKKLTPTDVLFKIVPRLNVAGRMGQVELALSLLLEKDDKAAKETVTKLEGLNDQRKLIEQEVRALAIRQIEEDGLGDMRALVLWGDNWHRGVLGIVASRVAEQFQRPAAIISVANDEGVGSIRGIPGVNLVEAMEACRENLTRFGGHRAAAGLTLSRARLESFRKDFVSYMTDKVNQEHFEPQLWTDGEIDFSLVSEEFLAQIALLEPFGEGNPEPVFTAASAEVLDARVVGQNHLKCKFRKSGVVREAIGFHLAGHLPAKGSKLDLAFTPRFNDFANQRIVQLELKDLRQIS